MINLVVSKQIVLQLVTFPLRQTLYDLCIPNFLSFFFGGGGLVETTVASRLPETS